MANRVVITICGEEYTVGPAGFRALCARKSGAQRVEKIFFSRCPYYQNL